MAVRKFKPVTPGSRGRVVPVRDGVYRGGPVKRLTEARARTGGRNSGGRMTVRHRGGGHRRKLRLIDFRRNKDGMDAQVVRIEYDPNRSAQIALLRYADGELRYIIAPKGVGRGTVLRSGADAPVAPGNCKRLRDLPVGTELCCIELKPGKGAQLGRSAGGVVQFAALEGDYAMLKLRSGELRKVHANCRATVGEVGNSEHFLRKHGKAGAVRWQGRRPRVRAVVRNPVDHPMGGGEGKSKSHRIPCSPTGVPAKGYKTRRNKRTDKMIVSRRAKRRRRN